MLVELWPGYGVIAIGVHHGGVVPHPSSERPPELRPIRYDGIDIIYVLCSVCGMSDRRPELGLAE